jgi:uncharacterized membrane protein
MNAIRRLLPFLPTLVLSVLGMPGRLTAAGGGDNEDQAGYVLSSIDVPGAILTQPQGINDRGAIVGLYKSSDGVTHGFLLREGDFTTVDYPGASYTDARGMNAQGEIVGTYHLSNENSDPFAFHGYLRSRKGQFSRIDFPGHPNTIAQRITSTGIVVGCYHDHDFMMSMYGFVMNRNGFSGFSVPASMHNGATPDGSVFAGLFTDSIGGHGYLVEDGQFRPFDAPGSTSTAAWDLNPEGDTVGQYRDSSGIHGFVRNVEGQFTAIDFPGSKNTQARGINARGDVVGWYVDSAGKFHGFLAGLQEGKGQSE